MENRSEKIPLTDSSGAQFVRQKLPETGPAGQLAGEMLALAQIFAPLRPDRLPDSWQRRFRSLGKGAEATLHWCAAKTANPRAARKGRPDVGAFGQVLAIKKASQRKARAKPSRTRNEAAIPASHVAITGTVTLQLAFSVDPVDVASTRITKSVTGESEVSKRGADTTGVRHCVDHGIYVCFASMNPQFAERAGFSNEDGAMIMPIPPGLLANDASSARQEGSMEVLKGVWWQHRSKSGVYSFAKVHRSLTVYRHGELSVVAIHDWPRR